ncbi:MAG: hypothetical protein HY863_06945 [Chloroflexi bacterium]|nr:hypothetical protein [Chloroflexota bacterium]
MKQFASYIKYLFFVIATALIFLAAGSFMRVNKNPDMLIVYAVYAMLMLGDALAMLICGLYIDRKTKSVFWFAIIILGLNIFLTIFDQFGLIDLIFVLLNLVTLAPLLVLRKEFLPQ